MQGSSACAGPSSGRTDFSIARILGTERDERMTVRVPAMHDTPQWLACSRYHPPKIHRNWARTHPSASRRPGRHARIPFTAAQARALEAAFARARYLSQPDLRTLAAALQLRDDRIKIWFQNRRARERREKALTISSSNSSRSSIERTETKHESDERCETPVDIETVEDEVLRYQQRDLNSLVCRTSYIHIQEKRHMKTLSQIPD